MILDERLERAASNLRGAVGPEAPELGAVLSRARRARVRRRAALGGVLAAVVALAVTVPVLALGGSRPTVVRTAGGPGSPARPGTPQSVAGAVAVPNVIGLDRARAVQVLKQVDLDSHVIGQVDSAVTVGSVIDQAPAAGAVMPRGGLVTLTVSTAGVPLKAVKWSELSYPVHCGGRTLGTVAGYPELAVGHQLAVIYVQCEHGAGNPPSAVLVYDSATSATAPNLLQVLLSYADDWSPVPNGASFRGRDLSVRVRGYTGSTARCCPNIDTTLSWSWDGTSYREQTAEPAHETLPSTDLDANGVGGANFGQAQATAVTTLSGILGGQPIHGSAAGDPNCGFDSEVQWPDLVAYFDHGDFVGYAVSTGGSPPAAGRPLVTAAGLRLGDSLDEARHLYGLALTTSYAQGGVWFVTMADGRLMGFLSSEPSQSGPTPSISTIEAGVVGCPAETP